VFWRANLHTVAWQRRSALRVTSKSVDVEWSEFRLGNKWRFMEVMQLLKWP
jgi:hypothetical protein